MDNIDLDAEEGEEDFEINSDEYGSADSDDEAMKTAEIIKKRNQKASGKVVKAESSSDDENESDLDDSDEEEEGDLKNLMAKTMKK